MAVVRPPSEPVYRVARGFDAFAPPAWEYAHQDGTFGNRFDDPGVHTRSTLASRFRMIYCATQRAAAFGETTARMRPDLTLIARLRAIIDDEPVEDALRGSIDPKHPERGIVPLEWRFQRRLGVTHLDSSLRFVDLAAAPTVHYLRSALAEFAATHRIRDVDFSTMTSQQRPFTQACARYVYDQKGVDGVPLYAGVRYLSRLNPDWECWAIFADRILHTPGPSETIHPDDPGLIDAARVLGLTIEGVNKGDYLRP